MWKFIKRWWSDFGDWVNGAYECELCNNEYADDTCVGCNRRICMLCNSGYYEDAELCKDCRKNIPPEEEEQDERDSAAELAEICSCPLPCRLDAQDHEFIAKYAAKENK